jgi:hypothetical protein
LNLCSVAINQRKQEDPTFSLSLSLYTILRSNLLNPSGFSSGLCCLPFLKKKKNTYYDLIS